MTKQEYFIGRDPSCDLRLESDKVSRRHCMLMIDQDRVMVRDMGSRNGTLVNGLKIHVERPLAVGHRDRIQIAGWIFRLSVRDASTGKPVRSEGGSTAAKDEDDESSTTADLLRELDELTTQFELDVNRNKAKSGWLGLSGEIGQPRSRQAVRSTSQQRGESRRSEKEQRDESETSGAESDGTVDSDANSNEKGNRPKNLSSRLRPPGPADSQDAATQALRRHFGG